MTNPEKPVKLTSVATEIEAASLVSALEAAGVQAFPAGGHTANFRAEAPGRVEIWVHTRDLAEAKQLLREIEAGGDDIDWDQVDVGRPVD